MMADDELLKVNAHGANAATRWSKVTAWVCINYQ